MPKGTPRTDSRNYNDPEYTEWRRLVKLRDLLTCQMCKKKGKRGLHVHHIRRYADYPELRYVVDNGICLCKACHKTVTGSEDAYAPYLMGLVIVSARKAQVRKKFHGRQT
jgi:5-methylcytosine-specific restriction endonuclease McrA